MSTAFRNDDDAFFIPNGVHVNRDNPWCLKKVVLAGSALDISSFQVLLLQSFVEKMFAFPRESMHSPIRGNGLTLCKVNAQSFL